MQEHAAIGGKTLDAVAEMDSNLGFLKMARDIAWCHHEKVDGSGYPNGLVGHDIPLSARIVSLADVYDALTSKRVYKEAFSHEKSRNIILEGSGSHFDPAVVDAFRAKESAFIDTRQLLQECDDDAATDCVQCSGCANKKLEQVTLD